jgi:hypothetical protein
MTKPTGWHYHVCDGQFVYVLKGWVDLEFEEGQRLQVQAGESLFIPGGLRHNETATSRSSKSPCPPTWGQWRVRRRRGTRGRLEIIGCSPAPLAPTPTLAELCESDSNRLICIRTTRQHSIVWPIRKGDEADESRRAS